VQDTPQTAGVALANWCWKGVRVFVEERFGLVLSRSSCFGYLHRLGFVVKRAKKRLLKADAAKRAAFVTSYAALRLEAEATGAIIIFVDEAHFRADVDLRAKWVLRGEPALADSTSPRYGEKATYYSGVCLETGTVDVMDVTESCTAKTSVAFLKQLRAKYSGPLIVIDDVPIVGTMGPCIADPPCGTISPRQDSTCAWWLCPHTAQTSTLMRPSGSGRARK